jgi:hypothetical protein
LEADKIKLVGPPRLDTRGTFTAGFVFLCDVVGFNSLADVINMILKQLPNNVQLVYQKSSLTQLFILTPELRGVKNGLS